MRQTVEAVTGQNIPSALATPVPQAPKPVVKEDWANCSGHKETLNSSKKKAEIWKEKNYIANSAQTEYCSTFLCVLVTGVTSQVFSII